MCGIVGVLSPRQIDPAVVRVMRDRLEHRGPDHAGSWNSPARDVSLGHRRLAIVDLTPDANQPFVSSDGRYVVTFNGEIYNFQAIRSELAGRGVQFRTRSDTEVLLEAFRCWGEACLPKLAGMFAFAIWDTVGRRLFCARDRAGEKPFYYAAAGHSFLFASELKALLAWPEFTPKIDYAALIDYLWLGFVADPRSIWEGCLKLPPGHFLWIDMPPGQDPVARTPTAYWDLEFAPDHSVSDWGPEIRACLSAAAAEMAFADVAVGTFLSGGVDSSSVTAALSREGRTVKTFTVGFDDAAYDERRFAAAVAAQYATEHTERTVAPQDAAAVFDKLLWHYDEPFNDYSYVPTYYVCREARKAITVALSGDGADELFGGYSKYQRLALREQFGRFVPDPIGSALAGGIRRLLPSAHRLQSKLAAYGQDATSALQNTLTTAFPIAAIRAAARGPLAEALKHFDPRDTLAPFLRKAPPKEVGVVNAMRYLDMKLTLAGDMLVKVDRASMAVALEVRPVYLHRDMLALAARIPASLLADRNVSKKALKSAFRPWLPDSILYRKKMGFAMPLEKWAGAELQGAFSGGSRASLVAGWLDVPRLEALARSPETGRGGLLLHNLFFLNKWAAGWASGDAGKSLAPRPVVTSEAGAT